MRVVIVESNTESYIIIKDMKLPPYSEEKGSIDVDDLLLSELKSLDSLIVRNKAIVEESDSIYIKNLIKTLSGGGGGVDPSELLAKEDKSNKVSVIDSSNSDNETLYPNLKAVKDLFDSSEGGGGGSIDITEELIEVSKEDESLPFSTLKESDFLLGNPDAWVNIGGYIVPTYVKERLEKE